MTTTLQQTVLMSVILLSCHLPSLVAVELTSENFDQTHKLIQPQANESQWLKIPWLTSIWKAREKAAAEGKPILIWSGGGAPPIGGC